MKRQIKYLIALLAITSSSGLWAQYGFGTNTPNPQAALDIQSPDKGVLFPKIGLVSSTYF